LVYRYLAILGRQSFTAALASDRAAEQGKFWEYHDILFASRGPFALTNGRLKGYAREIELDEEAFGRCGRRESRPSLGTLPQAAEWGQLGQ